VYLGERGGVADGNGGIMTCTPLNTPGPSHRIKTTVQVEHNCWHLVIDYIDSKYEDSLNAESRVNRWQMPDNRVQCCLYFIALSGYGLKPLDMEFMKWLHVKVNIIPLITKPNTMTPEECQQFKKQIMREIQEHKIKIYEFPDTDDEEMKMVRKIKDLRGWQYPWGVAGVNMLIRTHMQDLKLAAVTYNSIDNNKNKGQLSKSPLVQTEEDRWEQVAKMKRMEHEMEQVFEMKVKEKLQKLKNSEVQLQRRHEQMVKNLEAQYVCISRLECHNNN
uniref:Septin-type G domain-containing protein n=1 Tax=Sphaeramia orbicularis TaxID=375764 RepID=A0A672Z3G9_9TELE